MKKFFIFMILLLVIFFPLWSLSYEIYFSNKLSLSPCFTEDCLAFLSQEYPTKLDFLEVWLKLALSGFALFGIYIAYQQLRNDIESNKFNNEIRSNEFFHNMLTSYLNDSSNLKLDQVQLSFLYRSLNANKDSEKFENIYLNLRKYLIKTSNKAKANGKGTVKLVFIDHRKRVINYAKKIGVNLPATNKSDFYFIEEDFLNLLDYIALTFIKSNLPRMKDIDIYYR